MAGRHAIDHATIQCTARRDDMSTWTHAEGIYTAPLHLRYQRIRSIAHQTNQFGRWVVVHQFIDQRLWVLRAYAHRETFGSQSNTVGMKHVVGVVGGVTDGEDNAKEWTP